MDFSKIHSMKNGFFSALSQWCIKIQVSEVCIRLLGISYVSLSLINLPHQNCAVNDNSRDVAMFSA